MNNYDRQWDDIVSNIEDTSPSGFFEVERIKNIGQRIYNVAEYVSEPMDRYTYWMISQKKEEKMTKMKDHNQDHYGEKLVAKIGAHVKRNKDGGLELGEDLAEFILMQ